MKALENRKACLAADHGMIVLEKTLNKALALAQEVEHLATMYWHILQVGEPKLIGAKEMERLLNNFNEYTE